MAADRADGIPDTRKIGGHAALACAMTGLGAVLCVLLTAISTLVVGNLVRNQIRHRLRDIVAVAASRIDGDLHTTLTRPEQEGGPAYRNIQRILQNVQQTVADLHYVYTMRESSDGDIMFVVDEETNVVEIAHLGEIYDDAGPGLRARFASLDKAFVESEIYTDQWGSWLSGYAPFYDSEGRRAGVLGVDIRADAIAAARRHVLRLNLGVFAALLPVCALLGWFLADRMIVPVRKIAREAHDLIQWPHPRSVPGSRVAELASVGNALRTMRHLLDGMNEAVVATDLDGMIVYVNEAACCALQKTREHLLGKPVAESGENPIRGAKQSDILRMARESGHWEGEVVNVAKAGREIVFHSRVSLLHDDTGAPMGMLGVSTDITERQRAEAEKRAMAVQLQQAQRLESIGTLAGGVAHEINNPIMGIMNYAQLIIDKLNGQDEMLQEFAGEIINETERIATIVKNLLGFARRDEKQALSMARPVDIVQSTLSLMNTVLRHDQIALTVNVPDDMPSIRCHSQQLQQVLMNLVTNARDALNEKYPGYDENKRITVTAALRPADAALGADAPSGDAARPSVGASAPSVEAESPSLGRSATVSGKGTGPDWDQMTRVQRAGDAGASRPMTSDAEHSEAHDTAQPPMTNDGPQGHARFLRITVEDRGNGISEATRERLFEPFFTTKKPEKGTGLGLSISHGIVKNHGGELHVETEPGEWTRFHVDLPVDDGNEQDP